MALRFRDVDIYIEDKSICTRTLDSQHSTLNSMYPVPQILNNTQSSTLHVLIESVAAEAGAEYGVATVSRIDTIIGLFCRI